MPFIEIGEYIPADTLRKRMGIPNGFGWIMFGWSQFGDNNYYQGVYQQRRHRRWNGIDGFIISQEQKNFIQKPAWPVNTITPARTSVRNNFASAVSAWQALTDEQKEVYNRIATKKSRRGYNYFISLTLKS